MAPVRHTVSFLAIIVLLLPPATAVAEPAVSEADASTEGVTVELVDAGAEPRRELRLSPQEGSQQTLVMSMQMNQTISIDGNQLPSIKMPAQELAFEVTITEVDSSGNIHCDYSYTDAKVVGDDVDARIQQALEAQLESLRGIKGAMVLSSRGFMLKSDLMLPEGTSPQLKQVLKGMEDSMQQMCSPMPEEAVGVGASWKTTQNLRVNGIEMTQLITTQLTDLDERRASLKLSLTQKAENQEIAPPGLPAGVSIELKSLKSDGTGSMTVDSAYVMPQQSEVKSESKISMVTSAGGQEHQNDMTMEMSVSLKPKAASE